MSAWPTVERASLLLPTLPGHDDALWDTLIELTELRPGEWELLRRLVCWGGLLLVLVRSLARRRFDPSSAHRPEALWRGGSAGERAG